MDASEAQLLRARTENLYRAGMEAAEASRESAALVTFEEAADNLRKLRQVREDGADHDRKMLMVCLRNASTLQASLRKDEDALASAQEAVTVCREHGTASPDDTLDLASCLAALASRHKQLGHGAEALAAIEEATELVWPAFLAEPENLAEEVEDLLRRCLRHNRELGRPPPASLTKRLDDFRATLESYDGVGTRDGAPASEASANDPQQRILIALAQEALCQKAMGRDSDVLQWWCQLGLLSLSLAWRARGWHMHLAPKDATDRNGHWLVGLPSQSAEALTLRALALAHGALNQRLRGEVLDEQQSRLRAALESVPQADPVIRAARALQRAADGDELTLEFVGEVSEELLACVRAIAEEFQASEPRPHDEQYVGDLSTMIIPDGPMHPAEDEAMKVLGHVIEVTTHRFQTVIRI